MKKYPIGSQSNIQSISTRELQKEIKTLKEEIKLLGKKTREIETKILSLETQIAIIQSKANKGEELSIEEEDTNFPFPLHQINIPKDKPSSSQFISTIERIQFQKWLIYILLFQ